MMNALLHKNWPAAHAVKTRKTALRVMKKQQGINTMMGSKRLQRLNNGPYGEDRRAAGIAVHAAMLICGMAQKCRANAGFRGSAGGFLLADRYSRYAWRFLIKHDCRGKDDCLAQPKNASLHIAPDPILKVA